MQKLRFVRGETDSIRAENVADILFECRFCCGVQRIFEFLDSGFVLFLSVGKFSTLLQCFQFQFPVVDLFLDNFDCGAVLQNDWGFEVFEGVQRDIGWNARRNTRELRFEGFFLEYFNPD